MRVWRKPDAKSAYGAFPDLGGFLGKVNSEGQRREPVSRRFGAKL